MHEKQTKGGLMCRENQEALWIREKSHLVKIHLQKAPSQGQADGRTPGRSSAPRDTLRFFKQEVEKIGRQEDKRVRR